jgi:hypothetical protein
MIENECQSVPRGRECLVIRDEQEFCAYIETRLKEGGFELLETSPVVGWTTWAGAQAF